MSELQELIQAIRERIKSKDSFQINIKTEDKVYGDEKILITAKQMKNFRPPEIREMRRIAQSKESIRWSDSRLFYEQAKFMENYTDEKPYGERFEIYYPTYQRMSENQLRGYFTWRSEVRKGVFNNGTSATYWFIYIYEILHNIGVKDPLEGVRILNSIYENVPVQSVRSKITEWAPDYCAYYGVDESSFDCLKSAALRDKYIWDITDYKNTDDMTLYEAISALVGGSTSRSVLVKDHFEDHAELVCRVFRNIAERYERRNGKAYAESIFGRQNTVSKDMFRNAVFFDYKAPRSYTWKVSECSVYTCRNSLWSWTGISRVKPADDLRKILHEADNLLRKHYHYTNLLKEEDWSKEKRALAEKSLAEMLEDRELAKRRNIIFDVSLLDGIRKSSEEMREMLIVPGSEEEYRDETAPEPKAEPLPDQITDAEAYSQTAYEASGSDADLTAEELQLLKEIVSGSVETSGQKGMRVSLICESINEKFLDAIGDNIIEFDGDVPHIIEDYLEDVKGVIA